MNIRDILFMNFTGKRIPTAGIGDILFAETFDATGAETTISGNPLRFVTRKAQKAISTKITMFPIQAGSGDPSPTNIRPISGRTSVSLDGCGKNIFNESTIFHGHYSSTDGSLIENEIYRTAIIDNLPAGTYTFSTTLLNARLLRYWTNGENTFINLDAQNYTVTTTVKSKFMICWRNASSTEITEEFNTQIEVGSTATTYEPYTPNTAMPLTIQFGETVYGGTLDVEKGELTVDKVLLQNASTNWGFSNNVFVKELYDYDEDIIPLCNIYNPKSSAASVSQAYNKGDKTICLKSGTAPRIYIRDDFYDNKEDFMRAISGIQIVYALATPTTISLTPEQVQLLKGANTLWTDGDEIELTYKA
ncbi:MAG: hypothetical protein J6X14_00890 [Lachnospiraceae bacterium]|nr:hypothetical protein [Lachnospiraceae bacterium]